MLKCQRPDQQPPVSEPHKYADPLQTRRKSKGTCKPPSIIKKYSPKIKRRKKEEEKRIALHKHPKERSSKKKNYKKQKINK